jgi:SNF family Na+-dependent transporter
VVFPPGRHPGRAGSAIGLGNFLRFPGLAAQYSSGAFMIAYFASLVLLGIPIGWAEWTMDVTRVAGFARVPAFSTSSFRMESESIGALGVVIR